MPIKNINPSRKEDSINEQYDDEEERKYEEEDEDYKMYKEIIDETPEDSGDYRDAYIYYLSKVVDYEAIKWGTFTGSVEIEKWDETGTRPLKLIITLEYKTGDAVDIPYVGYPEDRKFFKIFKRHGWRTEAKGLMIYGYMCWRCKETISENKLKYDDKGRRVCPKCGAKSTKSHRIRIIKGGKWLYAYKKIKLTGAENRKKIRRLLIQNVRQPAEEFAYKTE